MNFVVLHGLRNVQLLIARFIIVCVAIFVSIRVNGQPSSERLALNNIQKGKWEKALSQLNKALSKDTLNVAASYVMARYFFDSNSPNFQLDSAFHYAQKASRDFPIASPKLQERLRRFPLDSLMILDLRREIDSAAFVRATHLDSELSYIDFITNFPGATQQSMAVKLRNSAAYRQAVVENSYQAFNNFLTKYPEAEQANEATSKHDELLYMELTKDKKLASYQRYLTDHPHTVHRLETERNIFEISTAEGSIETYKAFLQSYPSSHFVRRATDILFHLLADDQRDELFSREQNSDSLNAVIDLERGYIVPFLHEGRFGFMNQQGLEVIKAETEVLDKEYRCGDLYTDVIALPQKLVAINGTTIYNHHVESFKDLGHGFLLVNNDSCSQVIHKTGFGVGEACIQDAKVLNGKFLALQKDTQWSLWSLSGRMLLPFGWDDITGIKNTFSLKTKDKLALTTQQSIGRVADGHQLALGEFVDEIKGWRNDLIWVKRGNAEGVLDQMLDTVIQVKSHVLSQAYFGFVATTESGVQSFNLEGDTTGNFRQLIANEPWTAVKKDSSWYLFDPREEKYQSRGYDSIVFLGPFAQGIKGDSIRIFFSEKKSLNVLRPSRTEFLPGHGSSSFLLLEQATKKSIYTLEGKKLLTVNYDNIQYAGEGYFVVSKKEKKGLINQAGKLLLPTEFDALGTVSNGIVSLLKRSKFGLFDCKTRKLIKPQYNKNLNCYNKNVIIAFKDGMVGFIGWDNKPLSKLQFNEVRYWNDTTAFVRKDSQWMLYAIKAQRIVLDKISNLKFIQDGDEKLVIVQQDRRFGVIHNSKGTIIPVTFSDIINVGSRDMPLYFTEKHVEEASIFVVIYYDSGGNMLRKEVYEQDDYEKIYCSNN